MKIQKTHILLLLLTLILGACASKSTIRPGDTLEEAFEKSMVQFENGRYSDAARAFETVLSIGRGTPIARDAQFYLAESYYRDRQYLIAATEFRRYAGNFPNSERRQEAEYKEAVCYYHMSPRHNLDQTDTHQAIELFQLFMQRYPQSDYVSQASEKIDELRNKLAKKNFRAAELYLRTSQYNAAALYFGITMDRYPESPWAEKALANQIKAYVVYAENSVASRQQERYEKAVDSYYKYVQIFPRGSSRDLAEEYYAKAMDAIADLSEITAGR